MTEVEKKIKRRDRIVRILLILVIFMGVGFYVYARDYYRASMVAEGALVSGDGITFEEVKGDLVFTPSSPKGGVVIYPGGRVSERAYGHLARKIAALGYKTVIVKVPFKLSILENNAAKSYVNEEMPWVLIGHSLGGVSASSFAQKNQDTVDGLILLASYPAGNTDLSSAPFPVYSLVGDKDQVVDFESLQEAQDRLPKSFEGVVIRGGNHASFGNYGIQKGDSLPDISFDDQQQYVLDALLEILP
ncbi:alpha/beta hydrolase [Proteiniclasticum ruminis]|uniref:Alpha/beta hydrolase family protein n=1 Tax=Proteiniclasticum ruminis TaxID=398199 RepID=A0A1I5BCI5_9CLOT|nr:alpha/beta hydrolase [Proteiniclasticum ruminis]SFN72422.1 Alpha/beta hydrolase family protein [Proteiniclasticum ruminis]